MGNNSGRQHFYKQSDFQTLLHERGQRFHDWGEVARWLHMYGRDDAELKPSVAEEMMVDLERLQSDGVAFTADAGQVYKLAREHHVDGQQGGRRRVMPHHLHERLPRV